MVIILVHLPTLKQHGITTQLPLIIPSQHVAGRGRSHWQIYKPHPIGWPITFEFVLPTPIPCLIFKKL